MSATSRSIWLVWMPRTRLIPVTNVPSEQGNQHGEQQPELQEFLPALPPAAPRDNAAYGFSMLIGSPSLPRLGSRPECRRSKPQSRSACYSGRKGLRPPKLPLSGAIQSKEMFCTETSTTLPGTFPPRGNGSVQIRGSVVVHENVLRAIGGFHEVHGVLLHDRLDGGILAQPCLLSGMSPRTGSLRARHSARYSGERASG